MKLLHTSDLHIGKRLHEQPLIAEQRHMLDSLRRIALEHSVDAVIIAGDVYDRSVPSLDAVNLFDDFLSQLAADRLPVFIIAGNHDSADRLDFGARIMSRQNVHISGKALKSVTLRDDMGDLTLWLLPYLRTQAAEAALDEAEVDTDSRNVILAHQFVTAGERGPELGGSEAIVVGGVDAMDAGCFRDFDYVALGHIHRPQTVGRPEVRYSGSPYRYSFDECSHEKGVTLVELRGKGTVETTLIPLTAERDLHRLSCKLHELPAQTAPKDGYVEITLTDDEPVVDAIAKVRQIYPNTLKLILDSRYARHVGAVHRLESGDLETRTPMELFEGFFEEMNGVRMTDTQRALVARALEGGDAQ